MDHKIKYLILEKPTDESVGIMIYNNKVYHNLGSDWLMCRYCSINDEHIKNLIKIKLKDERRNNLK